MNQGSFSIRPCVLPHVEVVEACSRHTFPRHTHDNFGIGLIVSGAQRSWSGRGSVEAGRGNLITCNPGEVHDGVPIGGARAWKMLYLPPSIVATIVADIRDGATADFEFTEPVIDQHVLSPAFQAAYGALTDPGAEVGLAHGQLILLLAKLLRYRRSSPSIDSRGLRRAKTRIDDDPAAAMTLAELASEAGLSQFKFLRGFAKLTGLTPHAYIVQRRLDAARHLIAGGAPLADAAVACGFADQSHFNRTFVRRYGLTPGAYAEAMR
jgi:AraC-like DNA-binding protein